MRKFSSKCWDIEGLDTSEGSQDLRKLHLGLLSESLRTFTFNGNSKGKYSTKEKQ